MEREYSKEIRNASFAKDLPIMVSIVTIAYNVEKYLPDAIESVLNQTTNFKVELVIGEDCSEDATRQIALAYQQKYPDLITVLLPEKNQGLTPNCIATHNACKGKYIALLDGDDYWTKSDKLQSQIEFLEANPNYSGCTHQSEIIYEDGTTPSRPFGESRERNYYLDDTITQRKFHTSSLIYRKEIWDKAGGIPFGIIANERAIYPMVALFGPIRYLKESMCAYRITGLGISSRVDYKELEADLAMIPWLKKLDKNFPANKFRSLLHLCVYTYPVKKIPFFPLLIHFLNFSLYSFSYFPKNFGDLKWGTIFFFRRLKELTFLK